VVRFAASVHQVPDKILGWLRGSSHTPSYKGRLPRQ
jgi:hypothetical protein